MVERGVVARWSSILMILVWFTVLAIVAAVSGGDRKEASRRAGIDRFIADRRNQSLMCLYTFDLVHDETAWPSHPSSSRSVGSFDGDEGDLNVSSAILPTFEEHVGRDCPFGDLQFDPEIVIPLDSKTGAGSSKQLGVHLTVDPEKNAKRIQIASQNVVSASEFFSLAALHPNGVTFEMVLRRRMPLNQTMTLFRVGNSFDGCVDPGFRLDLNGYQVLTMIFFIPLLEDETEACYEQRLFSVNVQEECVLPSYQENADNNPPVHITVVINPSKDQREWKTSFYLTYVDSGSLQRKECIATDSQPLPDATLLTDFIQGTYRLFIGNNPRDGSEPQRRPILAMSRDFRDPFTEYKSPEKRLREAIKQKLMSIDGPRLPKTLKFFDTKSVSLKILGLHLPPIGADTPLAWVRGKLDDFKREHADVLVDFIVNSLRQGGSIITRSRQGTILGGNSSNTTDNVLYPDADASVFDLFHFALYKKPLTAMEVRDNWNSWLLPSRPFPSMRQTTHIAQDETVLLQLLQLHSVYDDVHLELVEYPEHGKLYLSPDMALITKDNLTVFKNLSVEDQKSIFFRPNPGQNNNNLPAQGRFGFRRQNRPYAVVQYRAWAATAGRPINPTQTAEIRIFVQPINSRPRLRQAKLNLSVLIDQPILLTLKGLDEGSPADSRTSSSSYPHNHRVLRQPNLQETMESINGGGYSVAQVFNLTNGMDFTTSDTPTNEPSHLVIIVQLPRYGMLYDRKMKGKSKQLQKTSMYKTDGLEGYEIRRADIPNQAFSTDLIYIYSGANGISHGTVVDSMEFHLADGDLRSLSPIGRIYFHLSADAPEERHVHATVIDVQEDSLLEVALSDIEPLIGQVGSRFCFVITSLPTHGLLYQYEMGSDENDAGVVSSGAQHNLGQRVEVNSLVEDPHGRVVYVPEPNYFNSFPDDHGSSVEIAYMNVPLENFEFKIQLEDVCGSRRSNKSYSLDDLSKLSVPRVVRIHVVSTPDELVILPPTYFVTNQGRGDPVTVPIIFEDADGYEGSYQVILDAEDDSSAFEFGHLVTDDDVLRYCPFERPCYLTRSINESYQSNGNGDNDEHPDRRMVYVIRNRNMRPSRVEVFGSKNALQAALPKMVFRDWSMWRWSEEHTVSFEVAIKRVNSSFDAATRSRFYIEYSNTGNDDDDESFIYRTISKLADVVWLGAAFLVMSFILSNAACCSYGFCCCCSKPRLKRRRALEARRRDYVAEVAQNDFEYSQLLMEVANLMLEPDLVIPTCLLRSLRLYQGNVGSSLLEDLCLRSLLPILETERQSTRLAYQLIQSEFKAEARARTLCKPEIRTFLEHSSIASKVLATFCRFIGHDWMCQIHSNLIQVLDQGSDDLTIPFCRAVDKCIGAIPPEIVILCRASAQLFGSNDFMDFRAVHLVFFNHFLAPSLWFVRKCPGGSKKTVISKSDQKRLRQLVSQVVGLMSHYDGATSHHEHSPKHQYHQLLQVIATSPRVADSYLPSSSEAASCQLMSMCLMNLHSVLETILPELEKEYKSVEGHHDTEKPGKYDEYGEDEENSIIRLKRVLRTLNFPVASAGLLVSHFDAAVANETFQAQGLSFAEWEDRIAHFGRTMNSEQKKEKLPRAVSMLAVDVHEDSDCDDTVFTTSQTQRNLDPRRTVYSDEHLSSPQEWQEDITIFRRSDCEKPSLHSRRSIEFEF